MIKHRKSSLALLIAVGIAIAAFVLGITKGSTIAGGADSSGYLNEAVTIAGGRLTKPVPLARRVPWPDADWTFAPIGWRTSTQPGAVAPVYPPGYPLMMAVVRRLAGPRAMFLVVPALGAVAVFCTFLLGRRSESAASGVLAALLLASSPPFVFQLLQPMSDVPATACWIAALVAVQGGSRSGAALSGLFAALAVLTRPNLAPIGVAIFIYLMVRDWLGAPASRRTLVPLLFAAPFIAGGAAVAWIQNHLYGSPFRTGYGRPAALYELANYLPNLHRYPRWLLDSETPLVLAALIAPIVAWRRRSATPGDRDQMRLVILSMAIVAIVLASYLFYTPFDNWTYLRFLLPAYPALFVLTVTAVRRGARRLDARAALVVVILVGAAILYHHVQHIRHENLLTIAASERRYERIANHVATRLAGRPIIIGLQHTGSVTYYSGALTVRWDWLAPEWLDRAVEDLQERGYRPMILLEEFEEAEFKPRFARQRLGKLDWPPRAMLYGPPDARLYDPADRARYLMGERWRPDEIK